MEFGCEVPGCLWVGKTKGALTNHTKRDHGDDPVAAVRQSVGPGAPRPGGVWKSDTPLKAAPSGVPSVDYAIGIGGLPRGTIAEVFGPATSGKTFLALTFSAYAQATEQRAGYMDAERALNERFPLFGRGLDPDKLEYGQPPNPGAGEDALEASRQYIKTGQFAIWTVDSVAALTPRAELEAEIGGNRQSAQQAIMMRQALRVIEHDIAATDTCCIFVNHETKIPQVKFGREWSKPAGTAFDFYAAIQLRVRRGESYLNKTGRRIGHRVIVNVHKSKVSQPHAKAEFDLYYADDMVKGKKADGKRLATKDREVSVGVDIPSCWFGILREEGLVVASGSRYLNVLTGEVLGSRDECMEQLADDGSPLLASAKAIVYPEQFR